MESAGGRFLFQQRKEKIDWRKLASIDVDQIARDVDVDAIQNNILSITYCNIEHELGYHQLDPNFIKIFRLSQLTVEYLLHCQEYLQQCMSEKEDKIELTNQQTLLAVSECDNIKADLTKRNESYKSLKKELLKYRKLIADYQLMVRAGANGLHKCPCCSKSFVSEYYLRSHIERRHPDEIIKTQHPISINQKYGDTELQNELNSIKSRLKFTENELLNEREATLKLKSKDSDHRNTILEKFQVEHEEWKKIEQEKMKNEIENYKKMVMSELKDSRKENETLQKNLINLQNGKKKSGLGDLVDEDEVDGKAVDNKVLLKKFNDLQVQFKQQLAENNLEHRNEMDRLQIENQRLLALEVKKREAVEKQLIDNQLFYERQLKEIRQELVRQAEHQKKIEKDHLDGNGSKLAFKPIQSLPPRDPPLKEPANKDPPPKEREIISRSPSPAIGNDKDHLLEKDVISLWVSLKSNGLQSYRIFRQPASTKGGWKDLFDFNASLVAVGEFQKPVYVYSCGGSPYWRQFVSFSKQPPQPNYKHDFTFYVSPVKLIGTRKFFILESGSGSVIRSFVSKEEEVPSWKSNGMVFYGLKHTTNKANSSRGSGTFNSSFGSTDDEEDDVSLSSYISTDIIKQNLADEIKRSRENLADDIVDRDAVDVHHSFETNVNAVNNDAVNEDSVNEDSVEDEENHYHGDDYESNFGTSSGSFLGSTIPERGEFYPFPHNRLAKAQYDHGHERASQERENVLEILEDNLEKHGVDSTETVMSSSIYQSKMKNHDKEILMIDKKFKGFQNVREDLQNAINDATLKKWAVKKKKNMTDKFKKAIGVVTACTSPNKKSDQARRPLPKPVLKSSMRTQIEHEREVVISHHTRVEEDDETSEDEEEEDEDDEYESIEENRQQAVSKPSEDFNGSDKHEEEVVAADNESDDEFDVSESSEWDSGDEDGGINGLPKVTVSQPVYQEDEPYNPKMRAPQGEKVRHLAASLEASLSLRSKDKKKPAGAVDLYNIDDNNIAENQAGSSNDLRKKRTVSFQGVNNDEGERADDFDNESDFSVTSFEASKNTPVTTLERPNYEHEENKYDIDAMLASYSNTKNPVQKPSASSTPYATDHVNSYSRTAVTALNLDDFDDDDSF